MENKPNFHEKHPQTLWNIFLNTFWNLGSDQIQNFLQKLSKLILLLSTFPKVFKKNVPQGLRVFLMKIRLVFHVGRGILKFHRQNFELGGDPFPPQFGHFQDFQFFFWDLENFSKLGVMLPTQSVSEA